MIYKKIQIDHCEENVFLELFVSDNPENFIRKAILIIPGGGYQSVCSEREGEPIALAFMSHGFNAFILHYSAGRSVFPSHLIEASIAMKYIKDNANLYNIDPENVFVVGFSAGGHLAASLSTMWDRKEIYDVISMPYAYNKPRGMMLIYPVISAKHHKWSFKNLLGETITEESLELCSIENCVNENTSPAFIVHTANDESVHVKNSLVLANALSDKEIPFEMHIYPEAPHGFALGNEITKCDNEKWCNTSIAKWVENAVRWAGKL